MFELKLFLGVVRDESLERELEKTNSALRAMFLAGEPYLDCHENYLGKSLPSSPSLEQIEMCEAHLLSLLRKLVPEYSFVDNSPVVVTINERS